MREEDIDRVYAELLNGVLARYCSEHGFGEYQDYEFCAFYAIRQDGEKKIGAISGDLDEEFINNALDLLKRIKPSKPSRNKEGGMGLVDL